MMIKRQFLEEFPTCKRDDPEKCTLETLNSPVVFCVDKISKQLQRSQKKHCDEFIFCDIENATGIYCIENKTGMHKKTYKIWLQIQGGTKIIEERLSDSEKFSFMPVLATPGIPKTWYINELQGYTVTLGSQERRIRHVMAGAPLKPLPPYSTKPKADKSAR